HRLDTRWSRSPDRPLGHAPRPQTDPRLAFCLPLPPRHPIRHPPIAKKASPEGLALKERTGGVLLSQGVAPQVPSALKGLTALFGMGRGVSLSLCATGNMSRHGPRCTLNTAYSQHGNKK